MLLNKRAIAATLASGSLLFNVFATTAFAETATISGNGADSQNTVNVTNNQSTEVQQQNTATVTNNVNSNATTGRNSADRNTGGAVTVDTGNATSTSDVTTAANLNSADLSNCATCANGGTANITGNGADSKNRINLNNGRENGTSVYQSNAAHVTNNVDSNSATGGNNADRNTGGTVSVRTGDAHSTSTVSTTANANLARLGGTGTGTGAGLNAAISGNGDSSRNTINLTANSSVSVLQANSATVINNVDSSAKTGRNSADRNTGGNVTVDTGNATANSTVDNMVNFNSANVDCGCLLGNLSATIGPKNGSDSVNTINLTRNGGLTVAQGYPLGNYAYLFNGVDSNAKTGLNSADRNGGSVLGDPSVFTGDADSHSTVNNRANVNLFGPSALPLPHWPTGSEVFVHFDMSALVAWFMAHAGA